MPIYFWRYSVTVITLALIYGMTGKLALLMPSMIPQVTLLYPPAGISQAALFLFGLRMFPGIVLGDFLVSLSAGFPAKVAIGMGAIASLQGMIGVMLLRRLSVKPYLEHPQDVLKLLTTSVLLSTTIGPIFGVSLLCWNNIQSWSNFGTAWWNWWLGNGMGVLVVMPVLLVWYSQTHNARSYWFQIRQQPQRYVDAAILLALLIVVSWVVFTSDSGTALVNYPLEYLPLPLIIWIAFRFAQKGTVLATFILSGIAIWGAGQGTGPFFPNNTNPTNAILSLQIFIAVISVTALLLAASIAERQQVEESLRSSQASLAEAQRIAHLGSWNLDLITKQLSWSDEFYRILGFSPQAFLPNQESFLKTLHPEDYYSVKQSLLESCKYRKGYTINYRIIRPDGEERIVREQAEVLRNQAGIAISIMGTMQDITKQKRIEQALVESESRLMELAHNLDRKVRERTEELQRKNQELADYLKTIQETQQQLIQSEKMSSLGNLVAGIAHEINNPVNFIYGNLTHTREYSKALFDLIELFQDEYQANSTKVKDYIEDIDLEFIKVDLPKILTSMQAGADRIRQIVLSLRNFSRLDEAQMKPVDIHEGIESTLLLLQQRLKGSQGNTSINLIKKYDKLPLVECYPGELNQVFMNLLINAIDAIESLPESKKQSGIINIQTQMLKSQKVLIKISDTGMGMNKEVKARIFDPFFTTKPVGKGTGLGLSISYQIIVEHHKGQLKCLSEPGKGTELQIEIPLRQSA